MKRLLFLLFLLVALNNYAQSLSKTQIIYERKDQIVLNNGKQYKIIDNKPFYLVSDTTIKAHKQFKDHLLRLNRVLILSNDDNYIKLIEWVKEDMKLYESREFVKFKSIKTIHQVPFSTL
ncbi:hypothetical protein [Aquimarina longa]|uniref:hypothetical protein n=1 Tax=Aquimarina longa TaxID=1080221 RepID=UPI0007808FDB|nr:hypothetical protein [Aquimarina longa]